MRENHHSLSLPVLLLGVLQATSAYGDFPAAKWHQRAVGNNDFATKDRFGRASSTAAASAAAAFPGAERYARTPVDVNAFLGGRIVLPCRSKRAEENVQWTKGGLALDREGLAMLSPRYMMSEGKDGLNWDLVIRDVQLDDDDTWDCQILGTRSPPAKVTVFVPPGDPYIEDGPERDVIENQPVTVRCISKGGKPAPKVHWMDPQKRLINVAQEKQALMKDSKLFEASSSLTITPTKALHNSTYSCMAGNDAGQTSTAGVRLNVLFAPSVTVVPFKMGMAREGEKVGYHCSATANPPPYEDKYEWFLDDAKQIGQFGFYYEIFNISRKYQNKQLKCKVENQLGEAKGLISLDVQYGPSFTQQPTTVAAREMHTATLGCAVDSNPAARYSWTKGDSREVVSTEQTLTLPVSRQTVGVYFCHASVSGFPSISSRAAEVLMKAPPKILSPPLQQGELETDVYINCATLSVPEPLNILWKFHGKQLQESNPHYRIINTPIQNGLRSTLIVRQTLSTDFGTYTCVVQNELGVTELAVELVQNRPFPWLYTVVGSFTCIIVLLVMIIFVILCRRHSQRKGKSFEAVTEATNNLIAANNIKHYTKDAPPKDDSPSYSNECDSAWEGSDDNHHEGIYGRNNNGALTQALLRENEPDFPPKPDIISTGYVPYGNYVRDFNPPFSGQDSPIYGTRHSLLNVSDPRLSATYGNPYLRQMGPTSMQYSTFLPSTTSSNVSTFQPFSATNVPNSVCGSVIYSRPTSNSMYCQMNCHPPTIASSTPNSSISNIMACLPEEANGGNLSDASPGDLSTSNVMSRLTSSPPSRDSVSGQYILPNGHPRPPCAGLGNLATHV